MPHDGTAGGVEARAGRHNAAFGPAVPASSIAIHARHATCRRSVASSLALDPQPAVPGAALDPLREERPPLQVAVLAPDPADAVAIRIAGDEVAVAVGLRAGADGATHASLAYPSRPRASRGSPTRSSRAGQSRGGGCCYLRARRAMTIVTRCRACEVSTQYSDAQPEDGKRPANRVRRCSPYSLNSASLDLRASRPAARLPRERRSPRGKEAAS